MGRINPDHPRLKRFGDKHRDYFRFAEHLVNEGDYIITEPIATDAQREWFRRKALWWAQRNNKVVKVRVVWVPAEGDKPAGKGMQVTLTRNYRYR